MDHSLDFILQTHTEIVHELKVNLQKSRVKMEKQANLKRMDFTFQPQHLVLLKLQPYRQQTVHRRASQKLAQRFFGPFTIVKWIGAVAYMLNLPYSSRIHLVFHVSLLRSYYGNNPVKDFKPLPPNTRLSLYLKDDVDLSTCKQEKNTRDSTSANNSGYMTKEEEHNSLPSSKETGTNHVLAKEGFCFKEGKDDICLKKSEEEAKNELYETRIERVLKGKAK